MLSEGSVAVTVWPSLTNCSVSSPVPAQSWRTRDSLWVTIQTRAFSGYDGRALMTSEATQLDEKPLPHPRASVMMIT